eukprot:g927.t1
MSNSLVRPRSFGEADRSTRPASCHVSSIVSGSHRGTLLCNVAWAFSFARALLGRREDDQDFLQALRRHLRLLGRQRDEGRAGEGRAGADGAAAEEVPAADEPRIVRYCEGAVVLHKPPGWEVDGPETKQSSSAARLSHFVRRVLGRSTVDHEGFLHRLDVQSSGLVIHAQSYEALLDLRWQQDTLQVVREYLVVAHGTADLGSSADAEGADAEGAHGGVF